MDPRLRQLARRLESCLVTDRFRIARQLRELRTLLESGKATDRLGSLVVAEVDRAVERAAKRAKALPGTSYPPDLPVTQRREEIADAIRNNQVVVVCGETGSGKTTQLPKICLDAGRGLTGMIGHTQPRRIAARSVAARIAQELDIPLGKGVGYKVRFGDKTSPDTFLKVMTDGMLLTETQHDRPLAHYDTLIIDEAHERSLNIDFLLGYLRQLLPRRPDLKLIITSATIDPKRFSAHFGDCPVIEVSGRMYPVEVRYRSLAAQSESDDDLRLDEGVIRSVEELIHEGPGDILVFLPGEREIRMVADDLRDHFPPGNLEIVPLYARLSAAEQERVFANHTTRRVVLSTNVAETSLTVPGIRYVIDGGLARISRYSAGTKVQRLPVETISRASVNQRSGRCGRLGPGIAIRLYSQADFDGRDAFTDPEIQRTNLASVILQMTALGLGSPESFPFLDPPDSRQIRDGYETLRELGAMDDANKLTPLGHKLAKLPVDPRIGRMILAGHDENCVSELLIIASALAVEDPRDRPMELADKADEAHAQFDDPDSDFIALLNLWREFHRLDSELSSGKLRKWCRQNFINWMKIREWASTHQQLARLAATLDLRPNTVPAEKDAVHRAMLTGLLCNLGKKHEEGGYTGCRNIRFHIFPGSSLFRKGPQFVMAAELVHTTKLYAREVAKVDPVWVERIGAHLIKRAYSEPHWDKDVGQVFAFEKVTLLGLELIARRRVHFGPIDPPAAREIFIQHALVDEQLISPAPFWRANRDMLTYLRNLSERTRRADIAVDPRLIFEFYDKRVPPDAYSTVSLDMWRKQVERPNPKVLFMSEADLTPKAALGISPEHFPDKLETFGTRLNLQYKYDTTKPDDGVTITVPLQTLHQLDAPTLEWLIPGLLSAKIAALFDTLPKALRKDLGDTETLAARVATAITFGKGPLLDAVIAAVRSMSRISIPRDAMRLDGVPRHLRFLIRVVDDKGELVGSDRDLFALLKQFGDRARQSFVSAAGKTLSKDRITDWNFGDLPERVNLPQGKAILAGYPALVDRRTHASLEVLESPRAAAEANRAGIRRLYILAAKDELDHALRMVSELNRMATLYATLGSAAELRDELTSIVADRVFMSGDSPLPRNREQFVSRLRDRWNVIRNAVFEAGDIVAKVLSLHQQLQLRLSVTGPPAWAAAAADIRLQLLLLVHKGSLAATPYEHLRNLPRYLQSAVVRMGKLQTSGVDRDARFMADMANLWRNYLLRLDARNKSGRPDPGLDDFKWLLEELRVSLFTQELGSLTPVSVKRLEKAWAELA